MKTLRRLFARWIPLHSTDALNLAFVHGWQAGQKLAKVSRDSRGKFVSLKRK